MLPGKGSVIGDALARHPKVRKISFTGGTTTGRHLAHVAAEKLIPASLELGGKSPTIVLEDADIEQAARFFIDQRPNVDTVGKRMSDAQTAG